MTKAAQSYPGSDGLLIYEQCAQIVRSYGPPCDESMRAGLLVAIEHFKGLYERELSAGATADKPALGVLGSLPSGESDPLVTTDSTGAGSVAQAPAYPVTDEQVETACAAYAKATGYYVEFHRGLKSVSSDRMRDGMRAALLAIGGVAQAEMTPAAWQYRVMFDATHSRRDEWCPWRDAGEKYFNKVNAEIAAGATRVQTRILYALSSTRRVGGISLDEPTPPVVTMTSPEGK